MTKNRWWTQLVKNEYPETQTSYGQELNALTGFRGKVNSPSKIERRSLKIKCDKCGTEHWVDKPCPNCKGTNSSANILDETQQPTSQKKPKVSVHCPNCGSIMRLRTARKGKYKGQKFWGCSEYPRCKGISQYIPSRHA